MTKHILALWMIVGVFAAAAAWADCPVGPSLPPSSDDLTSNRFDSMPRGTLQISGFYDGGGAATVSVQLADVGDPADVVWASLDVLPFSDEIATAEFDARGYSPTGLVTIEGVVPNGVIDGLAFGVYWKNDGGEYSVLRSRAVDPQDEATFVGAWPLGLNDTLIADLTPQLSTSFAREQVRAMLYGAQLLDNGCYLVPVAPAVAVRF